MYFIRLCPSYSILHDNLETLQDKQEGSIIFFLFFNVLCMFSVSTSISFLMQTRSQGHFTVAHTVNYMSSQQRMKKQARKWKEKKTLTNSAFAGES